MRLFDINIFSTGRENNVELDTLPGLIAISPSRKSARGRENDLLVVMASIHGSNGITGEGLNSWLQKKAETYHQTAGTVTFALKTLVDALNKDLLERNLRLAKNGSRISASVSLAVVRRELLYLVNIGSAHSYFSSAKDSLDLSDSDNDYGLGINQMLTCRFSQHEIKENDILVMSCQPPVNWKTETFAGCASLSNEAACRRLFDQVGGDLKAALLRVKSGKGVITQSVLHNRPASRGLRNEATPVNTPTAESESISQAAQAELDETLLTAIRNVSRQAASPVQEPSTDENSAAPIMENIGAPDQTMRPVVAADRNRTRVKSSQQKNTAPSPAQVKAGQITRKTIEWANRIQTGFSKFLQKILPGMAEEPLKWSRTALIGIAVGVPLFIALFAGMIYAKMGKSNEFSQNLVMAEQYAVQADVQASDPPMQLASLQQAMYWLDKAETYGESDISSALRESVQADLDALQGVQRLEMVEVIPGGLSAGSNITQIVATSTDLYLLDEISGTVKHYSMSSNGYENDEVFDCGPNPDNPLNLLGKIIDMVPVNVNNSFRATLFVIDASGNTEFCIPGEAGVTGSLSQPDQGWRNLQSIAIDGNYLYVLDTKGNAVYRYEGNGIQFEDKPTLYFDSQIPSLTEAIDIEVNGDELYILRSNGQMVECTYSHMKDYKLTECLDPAPYGDMRTGQVSEAISFPEAEFVQMRLTAAPDSSFYLLDATSKALYHFSLQRNLQKIVHPRLTNGLNIDRLSPTAIAISSGRMAFMAFGNQIYYSPMP